MKKNNVFILVSIFFSFCISLSAQPVAESPDVPYKSIGKLKTRTTHEISGSNWSVGGETMDRDYTDYSAWSPYLEALGIKKVRLQGGWAKCEKVKGVYEWAWLDEVIYDLPKKGIEPWVCLSYGNPLYGKGDVVLGSSIDTDEETRTAWLNWVSAFVSRYKDVVDEWEIWNEPNGHNPPEVYAELLMQTAELIKEIQPESKIIGFALAGLPIDWTEDVLELLQENNKTDLVDYLCYHPYNFNPDDSYTTVEELREVMKAYAPNMQLLQGENGAPSEWRNTKALKQYEWTELTQAKWALRRMLGDLGRDIPSSIFSIIDLKYPDEMNRKGLLYANDDKSVGHAKQAYYAVQNLATLFDDQLKRITDFEAKSNTQHEFSAFAFVKKIRTWWHFGCTPTGRQTTMPHRLLI
ncbi:MAG: hypothetical protein HC819_16885 [Cyclobacteriaceae bacterium]|nr:hypothetical protein [Cyclobacteriaceae bacterium]